MGDGSANSCGFHNEAAAPEGSHPEEPGWKLQKAPCYADFTVIGLEIMAITPSGSGETECSNALCNAERKALDVFSFGNMPMSLPFLVVDFD